MNNILITGIGGDIAQSVAKIIRINYPKYKLIGSDTHKQHGGGLFVDVVHNLPAAKSEDYLSKLSELIDVENVNIVFPMSEPELAVIGRLIKERRDIYWVTSGEQVVNVGLDKLATINALRSLDIPVPWTTLSNEGLPEKYPCILKSRFGSGSRSVFIIESEMDAIYLSKRNPDSIYQELLEPADKEVTCAVYRNAEGEVSTLQMLRKLVGGFTGWAIVINDREITEMCEKIAIGLDLRGSMNVQLRQTLKGPRVFEINPRFSSTALMRHELGFTDVVWALKEAENIHIKFPTIEPGKIIVRIQGAAVIN
jgi:carbamoyl-phosphate synthase large subunit